MDYITIQTENATILELLVDSKLEKSYIRIFGGSQGDLYSLTLEQGTYIPTQEIIEAQKISGLEIWSFSFLGILSVLVLFSLSRKKE